VDALYTKNGKPLQVSGDDIFNRDGIQVGRRRGDKIYGPDGRYAGTVVGDRVVYRSTQSGSRSSSFAPRRRVGIAPRQPRWRGARRRGAVRVAQATASAAKRSSRAWSRQAAKPGRPPRKNAFTDGNFLSARWSDEYVGMVMSCSGRKRSQASART
jgi:hypothetical protein